MIFNSGWSRREIEELTYKELFGLVEIYYKQQYERMFDFFKMFCISNAESTAVANSEKSDALKKYAGELKKRKMASEEDEGVDIDAQFEEELGNGQ